MSKIFYAVILIVFGACQNKKTKPFENSHLHLTEEERTFLQTFSDVDSLLSIDSGNFWNKEIYGPILFIDPETRIFYANMNNADKSFHRIGTIYTDTLPSNLNIANTAIDWDNKRWSMVMLPLPSEKTARNNLVIHELFHRLQPEIGFEKIQDLENGHLDTYQGRLLLRLELQALDKALYGPETAKHIQNALYFRKKRQKANEIKDAENALELNEGLAEYTAIMLSGRNVDQMKSHLRQSKTEFISNPTFVRSFAYQSVPFYGYLLSLKHPYWHKEIKANTNLTNFFIKAFQTDIDMDLSLKEVDEQYGYDYQRIENEEMEREKTRIEKIAKLKDKFTGGPTLELSFLHMNISFDPRNITPLENLGTVYPNLRIVDDWGILTVENGALMAPDWSKVIVTAPTLIEDGTVEGDGWKLELEPTWKVIQMGTELTLKKG